MEAYGFLAVLFWRVHPVQRRSLALRFAMAASGPSKSDLKRLFALSGNRCAFPRCTSTIILQETLVADVCHIKGEKRGAARFDESQTDEQRHAYDNLILLCKIHHSVIDDDEEAYTVERLQNMKSDHERRAQHMLGGEQAEGADVLISQVISSQQAGGITASSVTAGSITMQTGIVDVALNRRITAIEKVWETVCRLGQEFSGLVFIDTVLTANEINDYFKKGRRYRTMDFEPWADEFLALRKMAAAGCDTIDRERPFISPWLWGYFFMTRAVYGRLAYLFSESFQKRQFIDWRADNGMDQILRNALPSGKVDAIKSRDIGGIREAIDQLESAFLKEAERIKA